MKHTWLSLDTQVLKGKRKFCMATSYNHVPKIKNLKVARVIPAWVSSVCVDCGCICLVNHLWEGDASVYRFSLLWAYQGKYVVPQYNPHSRPWK